MGEFPNIPAGVDAPLPRMRLADYARFSECCLKSNPSVTARNCLVKRADERTIRVPFHFVEGSSPRDSAVE
jgi:hypothetical protein